MNTKICEICGKEMGVETHHLIFGRGIRMMADGDGITMILCHSCHEKVHADGTAAHLSKLLGQALWEINALNDGVDQYEVRNKFRERYGRSWL